MTMDTQDDRGPAPTTTRRPKEVWPVAPGLRGTVWRERGRVALESMGYVAQRWPTTVVVWLLIGAALALPAALYMLEANLSRAAGEWQGGPGLSVYFEPGLDASVPSGFAARLGAEPDISDVRLITPDQALAELRGENALAGAVEVFDGLEHNPLPATIRAALVLGRSPDRLLEIAESARTSPGVAEVVIEATWLERLTAIRDATRRVAVIVAALLGVSAVLISAASVRLAIAARLAEREVLALVGAEARFIRRPFLYLGVLYGIGGAVVAAVLLAAALVALEAPLARLFASYGAELNLSGFDPMFLGVLVGCGAVLGAFGARLAAGQSDRPP